MCHRRHARAGRRGPHVPSTAWQGWSERPQSAIDYVEGLLGEASMRHPRRGRAGRRGLDAPSTAWEGLLGEACMRHRPRERGYLEGADQT